MEHDACCTWIFLARLTTATNINCSIIQLLKFIVNNFEALLEDY